MRFSKKSKHIGLFLSFWIVCYFSHGQHAYGYKPYENKTPKELKVLLLELDRELQKRPSDKESYFNRILLRTSLGDTAKALNECDLLIKKDSLYWKAYVHRGFINGARINLDVAIKDFDKAIQLAPENPVAYNNKGYFLFLQKEYEGALVWFERAIKRDSLYPEAYINLIQTLNAAGKHEAEEQICNLLVNNFKKDPRSYIHRAEFYVSHGKLKEAFDDYNASAAADSVRYGLFWAEKIKFLDDVLYKEFAVIAECDKAVTQDPRNYLIYYMRSRPKLDQQDYRGVIADCSKSIELKRDYNPAYVMRGMAYAFLSITDSSFHDFDTAIAIEPQEEEAYMQKVISYVEQEDYQNALLTIDKYLENDPALKRADIYKPTEIFLQRGNINFALKNYSHAVNDLNRAIGFSNTNSDAWAKLGEVYFLLNEKKLACEAYTEAERLGDMKAKSKRILNCR